MGLTLTLFNTINLAIPFKGFFTFRRLLLRAGGVTVGRGTRIATGAKFYDKYITIGERVWIGPETMVYSSANGPVTIGDQVDIAPGVTIVSGSHELGGPERRAGTGTGSAIVIGDGTWVGARALILGGARIGRGCMVAAGAVVTPGEYPDNVLLAGVPAVVKRTLPDEHSHPSPTSR